MERTWKCQRVNKGVKCGYRNLKRRQICVKCGKRRPATKQPAHMAVLRVMTYEQCVELWGERCGICGRSRTSRRLDRDHDHKTGKMRGLLCSRCNQALRGWVTPEWCDAAAAYLRRNV